MSVYCFVLNKQFLSFSLLYFSPTNFSTTTSTRCYIVCIPATIELCLQPKYQWEQDPIKVKNKIKYYSNKIRRKKWYYKKLSALIFKMINNIYWVLKFSLLCVIRIYSILSVYEVAIFHPLVKQRGPKR